MDRRRALRTNPPEPALCARRVKGQATSAWLRSRTFPSSRKLHDCPPRQRRPLRRKTHRCSIACPTFAPSPSDQEASFERELAETTPALQRWFRRRHEHVQRDKRADEVGGQVT